MTSATTLFFARIGNMTEVQLRKSCEHFGVVKDVTIIRDSKTKKTKNCGFVKFTRVTDACKCMEYHKRRQTKRSEWIVEFAKSSKIKESDLDKTTLYIIGMTDKSCNEDYLHNKLDKYGKIERITIPKANQGEENYCFIRFEDEKCAAVAKDSENGKEWDGNYIVIEFSENIEAKRNRRQKVNMNKMNQFFGMNFVANEQSSSSDEESESEDEYSEESEEEESIEDESEYVMKEIENSSDNELFSESSDKEEKDENIFDLCNFSASNSPALNEDEIINQLYEASNPFESKTIELNTNYLFDNKEDDQLPIFKQLSEEDNAFNLPSYISTVLN